MKQIFEFKCAECGLVHEEYTEYKQVSQCPSCNGEADKIISAPRVKLEGITGAFPGASLAWEKRHKVVPNKESE